MDEIIVKRNSTVICFYVESPFMICGRKNAYVIDDVDKLDLPFSVKSLFKEWSKFSNLDGNNGTLDYYLGDFVYTFVNHYWD